MKFEVYHAKMRFNDKGDPIGIAGSFGHELTVWPDDYAHVANVETETLDDAFRLTQHMTRPWQQNPGVEMIAFPRPPVRNTSVGDILVRHDPAGRKTTFVVAPLGFSSFMGNTVPYGL